MRASLGAIAGPGKRAVMKQRIGLLVREARARRCISQEELAGRVHIAVQSLSRIERGRALPSVPTLAALARELDVPVRIFFGDADAERGGRREELETELALVASDLGEQGLEIALAQVKILAEHFGRRSKGGSS